MYSITVNLRHLDTKISISQFVFLSQSQVWIEPNKIYSLYILWYLHENHFLPKKYSLYYSQSTNKCKLIVVYDKKKKIITVVLLCYFGQHRNIMLLLTAAVIYKSCIIMMFCTPVVFFSMVLLYCFGKQQ